MKVINNRAKSATLFFKVNGKMNKVKLLPFESFSVRDLVDINAVKNSMTITNFIATDRAAYYATISAMTAVTLNITNPYNDTDAVSPLEWAGAASITGSTFSRRKIPLTRQTKGRFEIKYR